ncbi:PIN-like domain-containing protein [Streptomyces hirsutus]|uniref:PIN-like domain-containing protein n=1 Tax=Streptomyces hirsutus TaxID=35620 RepID=UPI0012FEC76D|nr:PIN-like domain-containing protein [Streptomyces hirsutus]
MTKRELAEALKESLIVLDSSVMLDLYRVTPSARAEMINSLLTVKEILWIPYQVALEFHSNRVEAAQDQLNFYNETCKSLEAAQNQAIQRLNEFANRSALGDGEKKKLKGPLEQAFRVAIERVRSHQGVFDLTLSKVLNDDPVLKALAQLLDGRVGEPLSEEEYAKAQDEAVRRKEARIPPGYKDRAKKSNSAGDYIWWEQTLIKATETQKPILIISNDEKEDWITKRVDFSLGPRAELVQEMRQRAGVSLRIVNFPNFLEGIRESSAVSVSRETLSQANIARQQGKERSSRVLVSPRLIKEFEAFMLSVIEERQGELSRKIAERDKVTGDLDVEDLLDTEIQRARYVIEMYQDWIVKIREAVSDAPTLKGDLILRIEDGSLRRALLKRLREQQERSSETS